MRFYVSQFFEYLNPWWTHGVLILQNRNIVETVVGCDCVRDRQLSAYVDFVSLTSVFLTAQMISELHAI